MHLLASLLVLLGSVTGGWPLAPPPQVVRPFQSPSEIWGAGHRGVDLLGVVGQEVDASVPGTVTFVGRIAGVGIVVVSHGDTRTTYQPVASSVVIGQAVEAGAALGRLELAGSHCLPLACLHWGLLRGRDYLDPMTLVGPAVHVRLLPLDGQPLDQVAEGGSEQLLASITRLAGAGLGGVVGLPVLLTPGGAPADTPVGAGQR